MNEIVRVFLLIFLFILLSSVLFSFSQGIFHPMKIIHPETIPSEINGIQYVGHGTLFIQLDNHRILTDPILKTRIAGGLKRFISLGINTEILSKIDIVLISHKHADHFHLPSLHQLSKEITLIVPVGLKSRCIKAGFTHTIELSPSMQVQIDNITILAVETEHPTVKNAMGFIIKSTKSTKTLYFPGDTALSRPKMQQIGENFSIDIAFLPIGCYRGEILGFIPTSFSRFHMGPKEISSAIQLLQPKNVIPIHWGTFLIGSEPIEEAKRELKQIMQKEILPITILEHGKWMAF